MTAIPDLSQCDALPTSDTAIVSVGWLGRDATFPTGPVDAAFFEKLTALCNNPWQPFVSSGKHECELCQFNPARFGDNLFVPHGGRIYAAPVGVLHYIATHWYRPPDEFIAAVLACPPTRSMEYKMSLLANGGRSLLQSTR